MRNNSSLLDILRKGWLSRVLSLVIVVCFVDSLLLNCATFGAVEKVAPQTPKRPMKSHTGISHEPSGAPPAPGAPPRIEYSAPRVQFPEQPTEADILRAQIFSEGLVPIGRTSPPENKALAETLLRYLNRKAPEDQSALSDFLQAFPDSAWKPVLLLNLGIAWRQHGYFSRALAAWEEGWARSKTATDSRQSAVGDRILGELAQINAWVGRYDRLESLFKEIKDRPIAGGATEMLAGARQGLWTMHNRPEVAFRCGPFALFNLANHRGRSVDPAKLEGAKSTVEGISLATLQEIANDWELKYQMALRQPGAPILTNAVVHWKLNHYGAIMQEKDGRYLVKDSTFSRLYGHEMWLSKAAIEEESSGYFLLPVGKLPKGWRAVKRDEASRVFGKGETTSSNPNNFTPKDKKNCDNSKAKGMPEYAVHLMLVSLNIVDIPLSYEPPRGPELAFRITYNQRDSFSSANPTHAHLGKKWTFDWLSYIEDNGGSSPPSSVTRYVGGGGKLTSNLDDAPTGRYATDLQGNELFWVNANEYKLVLPDGSKHFFAQPSTANPGPRKMFLTRIEDPAGNPVVLEYINGLLKNVYDALGQKTELFYELSVDPFRITRIKDPFGREAVFEYDGNYRLRKVTDPIRITSSFFYGNDFYPDYITQMTTPYGITTFTSQESDYVQGQSSLFRQLIVGDPLGGSEKVQFVNFSTVPPPPPGAPAFPQYRNTFYWSKKAMQEGLGDYYKAYHYQWLHDFPQTSQNSGLLESEQPQLEGRIYYWYPGQTSAGFTAGITLEEPSRVWREVNDYDASGNPTTMTQEYQYTYNSRSQITSMTDPRGRRTTFDYHPNGIDVWKVRQTTGSLDDLLAIFPSYNAQHRPMNFSNSAGAEYVFEWNPAGQLTYVFAYRGTDFFEWMLSYSPVGYLTKLSPYLDAPAATRFTYDSFGRIREMFNDYLALQSPAVTIDYDALDRPTQFTYADSTTEKVFYDRLDVRNYINRLGQRTTFAYDALGRPTGIKDPLGRETVYTWCNCGALESIKDPLNQVTQFTFDVQGRTTKRTFQDGKEVSYVYEDLTSRLKSVTDAKNQSRGFKYFPDDSLRQITYVDLPGITTPAVSFSYDASYSRITTLTDQLGTTTVNYGLPGTSAAGEITSIMGATSNGSFAYDGLGRIIRVQPYPEGTWGITRDQLGRVQSFASPVGSYSATFVGNTPLLASVERGTGQDTLFDYHNSIGEFRLKEIWHKRQGDALTISKFNYVYDSEGLISSWTQATDSTTKTWNMEYDRASQLLRTSVSGVSPPIRSYNYTYDSAGNRLSEHFDRPTDNLVNQWTPNAVNQLETRAGGGPIRVKGTVNEPAQVQVNSVAASMRNLRFQRTVNLPVGNQGLTIQATDYGAGPGNTAVRNYSLSVAGDLNRTYEHDNNGNLYRIKDGSGTVLTEYTWDAADRLIKVTQGNNASEFTYDGLSRLVRIVDKVNGTTQSDKQFTYDFPHNLSKEVEATTGLVTTFHPQGFKRGTLKYLYIRDHLGSVREVTDLGGNVYVRYEYDPYGRRTKVQGSADFYGTLESHFGFTGFYHHAPSGLCFARYRAYNPDIGRWMNRDPIEEDGGLNLYAYVENNPVNFIDPLGLCIDAKKLSLCLGDVGLSFLPGLGWFDLNILQSALGDETFNPDFSFTGLAGKISETMASYYKGYYQAGGGDAYLERQAELERRGKQLKPARRERVSTLQKLRRLSKGLGVIGKALNAVDTAKSLHKCYDKSKCKPDCKGK